MSSQDESGTSKSWRDLGQAIGGFARKVGQMVDDLQETARLPENLRQQLEQLAAFREREDFEASAQLLLAAGDVNSWAPELAGAAQLTRVHARIVGASLHQELSAALEKLGSNAEISDRPEFHLWAAVRALYNGRPLEVRDSTRRGKRRREQLTRHQMESFDDLVGFVETQAHLTQGYLQRAQRSLMTRLARRESFEATGLDLLFAELAVDIWLALDQVELAADLRSRLQASRDRARKDLKTEQQSDARASAAPRSEGWQDPSGPSVAKPEAQLRDERFEAAQPRLEALWARVETTRGDQGAAKRWLESVPKFDGDETPWRPDTALRLALATGEIETAKTLAISALRKSPSDPRLLRRWALAELADASLQPPWTQDSELAARAIESLWPQAEKLEGWARREALREIAFFALHAGVWKLAQDKRISEMKEPTPEVRLLQLGALLASSNSDGMREVESALREDADQGAATPLRLPEIEGPHGPDELSPLRSAESRESCIAAHAHLIASQGFEARGTPARAHQALVDSLIECPDLQGARERLLRSRPLEETARIEDLLAQSTRRLGRLPRSVSGLPIDAIERSLERVVTIRERLARPLTIAIMGEFSSGKSTFVNAWLGRQLAPMGALPTTCTINVFRHGGQGQARIHRRDGRIELVAKTDLLTFLDGLDEGSARSIRHVEIERGELGGGHASIVDTPGLNALDPYHEQVAREFLAEADAVVWVFSASQGAAASERAMLDELRGDGRKVLGVLNKIDILEEGEDLELMTYLREKLGDVLVDILPLSATGALSWREGLDEDSRDALGGPQDPMAKIDAALERHFLGKARELKVDICRSELRRSLDEALEGLEETAGKLETRVPTQQVLELAELRTQLSEIIEAISKTWSASSELLNRELMALGVYEPQHGAMEGRPDSHDYRYFSARLSREAASAMTRCLFELRASAYDDELLDATSLRLVPWLNGYLGGLGDAGELRLWLERAAKASAKGEDAARVSIAGHLESMSVLGRDELGRVEATILAQLRGAARRRGGRGIAEALGLRALGESELQPLIEALAADASDKPKISP